MRSRDGSGRASGMWREGPERRLLRRAASPGILGVLLLATTLTLPLSLPASGVAPGAQSISLPAPTATAALPAPTATATLPAPTATIVATATDTPTPTGTPTSTDTPAPTSTPTATTLLRDPSERYGPALARYAGLDGNRPLTVLVPSAAVTAVVLVLHGYELDNGWAERTVALSSMAATHGWLVAYPSGVNGAWNAGRCCGSAVAARVDDVGYLSDLVARLRGRFVVAGAVPTVGVGFSNGAMELAELACRRPGVFQAVEEVAGTLQDADCPVSRARTVVQIRGAKDTVVPVAGGYSAFTANVDLPDAAGVRSLSRGLRCHATVAASRGLAEQRIRCDNGDLIERLLLRSGGHTWSGASARIDDNAEAAKLILAAATVTVLPAVLPARATCTLKRPGGDVLAAALTASSTAPGATGCRARTRAGPPKPPGAGKTAAAVLHR